MTSNEQLDFSYINEIAEDGGYEFAIEIITEYLNTIPGQLIQFSEAIRQNNTEDIHFTGHKLKGAFKFIGSLKMSDLAEQIEQAADEDNTSVMLECLTQIETLYPKAEVQLGEKLAEFAQNNE